MDAVNDHILNGLGANLNAHQLPVLDIVELTSILLIPHLKRASSSSSNEEEEAQYTEFFKRVHFLFRDSLPTSDGGSDLEEMNDNGDLVLTPALLQAFLEEHGEYDVPPQIIHEMVAYARTAGETSQPTTPSEDGHDDNTLMEQKVAFSLQRLTHALTSDLGLYDPSRESHLSTHFQDVLASVAKNVSNEPKETIDNNPEKSSLKSDSVCGTPLFERVFSAPSIDLAADNFTSPIWVILVWLLLIILYVAYVARITGDSALGLDCKNHHKDMSPFSCHLVNGIIT